MEDPRCSPIIIAVGVSSTYLLTSPQAGVWFDIDGNRTRERMAWTRAGDDIAFLVLDRNGNGMIDDGTELFGNHSVLPSGQKVGNGFEALIYYDRPENGGNGDGIIDVRDSIWPRLQLWIDWNHNGVSEAEELSNLWAFDLKNISLNFDLISRRDSFGNLFRLRANCQLGSRMRQAYDVYFSARPAPRP